MRTARAKGLDERVVVLKHALRNALTPVITLGALEFGTLLSGAVLTEQVFTIPGFGKLIVDAVFNRDYAVVQGVVLFTATAYIALNLLADLAYFAGQSAGCAADGDARCRHRRPVPREREPRRARAAAPAAPARRRWSGSRSSLFFVAARDLRAVDRAATIRWRRAGARCARRRSAAHWFGTDEIGRDVLSRVIWGARASLLAGVVSVLISLSLGVPIGLARGLRGGWTDALISRIDRRDARLPFLILAIALAAFLGPSLTNAMIAIGISATPIFIRLTRAQVLAVKVEDYVEAARAVGNPHLAHRAAPHPARTSCRR